MAKKVNIKKQSYYPWWSKTSPLKITRMNIKKQKYSKKLGIEYALVIRNESNDNEYNKEI